MIALMFCIIMYYLTYIVIVFVDVMINDSENYNTFKTKKEYLLGFIPLYYFGFMVAKFFKKFVINLIRFYKKLK